MSEQSLSTSRPIPPGRGLQYRLEGLGALLLFGLFRLLPLDWASSLGGFLAGRIGPLLGVSKRAHLNLRRAMPELDEAASWRVIAGMWDNLGRVVAEYPHLDEFDIYKADGRVEIVNAALVDPILAAGKKIIFVSAHFGNWEVASLALTQRGLSVVQVYRAPNNPLIDRVIGRFRNIDGSELIPKGAIAARRAIEALHAGRHLGILVDQKMNDGIAVPFFGRPAMTAPAVAQLAARFDCVIVPARCERLKGAHFRITVFPPVEVARTGDRRADAVETMTRVNAVIESWIRERPELWFWLHRRWPD
jgi:KDO2-lipid IV(A) lauroyltransferase